MKVTTDACLFGAWVAREMKTWRSIINSHGPGRNNMLDIGTGTGLLTLMIAQEHPGMIIDSIEIDRSAYDQAKENIKASRFKNKIYLWHDDILKQQAFGRYDFVVSNPPFYENELRSSNSLRNIAHHDEGLPLEKLLQVIKQLLVAASKFYLLLPYKRKTEIEMLFQANELFPTKIVFVRQSVDHDIFRLMIEGSLFNDYKAVESEISIKNGEDHYTPEFSKLLKDYYLHL